MCNHQDPDDIRRIDLYELSEGEIEVVETTSAEHHQIKMVMVPATLHWVMVIYLI